MRIIQSPSRKTLPILLRVIALALLVLWTPAARAQGGADLDLQITIFAIPGEKERLAVSYVRAEPPREEIDRDIADLARQLGQPPPSVKVSRRTGPEGFVTVEAELTGLTNWLAGQANLDALLSTYRRFSHLNVYVLFGGQVTLPPRSEVRRPPLTVVSEPRGSGVLYDVRIDQSRGVPQGAILTSPAAGGGTVYWIVGGVLLVLVAGSIVVWFILSRRAAPSPGGEAVDGSCRS